MRPVPLRATERVRPAPVILSDARREPAPDGLKETLKVKVAGLAPMVAGNGVAVGKSPAKPETLMDRVMAAAVVLERVTVCGV